MTGRRLFELAYPAICVVVFLTRMIPRSVMRRLWWTVSWVPGILGVGLRYVFSKRLCKSCGKTVFWGTGVIVDNWSNLSIGDNVNIRENCYVDALGGITIGDNVSIAHASSLVAFEHGFDDVTVPIKYNPLKPAPIEISSDVWVGCGVRILSGSKIGERTVIAAGAVVPRGEYSGGIYGGVPVKLLKRL